MSRLRRSQRIAAIVSRLLERPGELIPLSRFVDELAAAKSTVSEDIGLIRDTFEQLELGRVETVAGAAGGVRYVPWCSPRRLASLLQDLSRVLSSSDRLLPGGFVYMTDIVFSPRWASRIGDAFATVFSQAAAEVVLTVETKGIPLALMTARALGLPLVTCRRNSRVTEGSSISITYVSGSSRQIETMSLAKRAMAPGSRVLFIDDFLKGGGTAKGMHDLMAEFGARMVGTGVLVATREPERKLVEDYVPLVWLETVDPERQLVRVLPNEALIRS
ncbi:MAG TPA: pur operon repressor [Bacillota bacterium]